MRPQLALAPLALWVLAGFALLLGLWALCTACHRKRAPRPQVGLQGVGMPADASLLRQADLCVLSRSDTRLHELHRGLLGSRVPRPASVDLLHPHWLEGYRGTPRLPAAPLAFPHQELPWPSQPVLAAPAICSSVGLAALPKVSLAASPEVWSGARLTSSWTRPAAGPVAAEYACIRELERTCKDPHGPEGKNELTPAREVDVLYSRVNKPKKREAGPATEPPDSQGRGSLLAPRQRGLEVDHSPPENVYESIREMEMGPSSGSACCVDHAGLQPPPPPPQGGLGWPVEDRV